SRRRHTRSKRDWSSDVCSSDLGSRGIGRAIVERLAQDGAVVAFIYRRDAKAAAEVEAAVRARGRAATALQADLGAPAEVAAALEIGRASCRERGEMSVVDASVK